MLCFRIVGIVDKHESSNDTVIESWNFTDSARIPSADGLLVHVNWWLFQGKSDLSTREALEVVLQSFTFIPMNA